MFKLFVVVVCGVFLGLALSNLNQARRALAIAEAAQGLTRTCLTELQGTLLFMDNYLGEREDHGTRTGTDATQSSTH